jgi:hypothetical protein
VSYMFLRAPQQGPSASLRTKESKERARNEWWLRFEMVPIVALFFIHPTHYSSFIITEVTLEWKFRLPKCFSLKNT